MTDKQRHLWELVMGAKSAKMDYELFTLLMKARRYAARYHRLCEDYCNGEGAFAFMHPHSEVYRPEEVEGLTEEQLERRIELPFKQIENKLFELFHSPEVHLTRADFQRDPRGWEIKLRHIPSDTDLSDWLYRAL